ncbi:helix-turn-helix domain-containing protein [Natronorubrum sp. JWXQ-INN-674]|uniref:Helix-turn-helix domain-containing protein n=1 Tax=Natronorubrum halalkaliphilum TaxID=2691917 RepID=A0A6B0VHF2_9EURY|nr:IclR family transcriptional regulator [Natronorubrum halalkaliphilum]MXV60545.1 helix-turn-helix domain-containing protein [Natronorubrum halalkaliphilum]
MEQEPKYPVRTTETTLAILDTLKEANEMGVTELSNQLNLGKSTVHNHLSTLRKHDFVVKEDEQYRLGLRFLELGGHSRNQMKLYEVAEPEVRALAEETEEMVNLATHEHGKCVYLYRAKGAQAVELDTYAGLRTGLHSTALGKAMLAHLPESRVDDIIETNGLSAETQHTITDRDELHEELETIRERGVAFDREERLNGLRCVAAPITDTDGRSIGAISVAAPTGRLKGDRFSTDMPDTVHSTANVIELSMTHM